MPFGYEPGLIAAQAKEGLGIFGCDAFQVFSDSDFSELPESKVINITAMQKPITSPRGGKYNSYLNAPIFQKIWKRIVDEGRYRNFDWVLKVDADLVLLPDRMRNVLSEMCNQDPCEAMAVNACADHMIPGPVQALSSAAVEMLVVEGERCRQVMKVHDEMEDGFLENCLNLLEIPKTTSNKLINNFNCWELWNPPGLREPLVCDGCRAAFHPFKSIEQWNSCWYWAKDGRLCGEVRRTLLYTVAALIVFAILFAIIFACCERKRPPCNKDVRSSDLRAAHGEMSEELAAE